jgi:hypothetical protein
LPLSFQPAPAFTNQAVDSASRYYDLGLEAADWITSFQLTPSSASWGIPYQDQRTWGLDPFYFENGTITAEVGGITAGERQSLAFLIGGHDSVLGASAALNAYMLTKDPKYLKIFTVYFDYFQNAQIPGIRTRTPPSAVSAIKGRDVTLVNAGFWAEQANVSAGMDRRYGTDDDSATLLAVFPSPEHGNPIAAALISYYRWTNDSRALQMLNRYGSWLVKTQIKTGNFSGAFPVTQYYWALGWKPRMFETTESAWILAELYLLTGNRTYLDSAVNAGQYMLTRQFTGQEWSNTPVYGALPYESNGTEYTTLVPTNHAVFTLLAWAQLFRITGDSRFLTAAETYARWLMSFQVTRGGTLWGNHTYSDDSMAVGGYYYGYNTPKHRFGGEVALSLWSAAYAIPGLILLSQTTKNMTYLRSAQLAADWLTRMRYPDTSIIPLRALAITKYTSSSWWGIYPQFYQPDMGQIEKAGIPSFVEKGRSDLNGILNKNPTWFERAFNVNFNLIEYQMASRGPESMKMIWSWWPSIGFEPRYGGDMAFGAFAIGSYLAFIDKLQNVQPILSEIERSISDKTLGLPENITASYNQVKELVSEAMRNFSQGWYSVAVAEINEASIHARDIIKELGILVPILQTTRIVVIAAAIVVAGLAIGEVYLYHRLRHLSRRERGRQLSRRARRLRSR